MVDKIRNEYVEMVVKSTCKMYTEEDRRKLGMEPTPKEAVYSQGTWTLYRYCGCEKSDFDPVLVIPSLINRPYIMDLLPGHSLIESLTSAGLDVFLLDWGFPDPSTGHLGLPHYVGTYIHRALRQVRKISGSSKVQLMGQCLGGTMAAIYASHPEFSKGLSSLALLTTPVNFEDSGLLAQWTANSDFDIVRMTEGVGPVVPAEFFHSSFPLLDVGKSLGKYRTLLESFEIPKFTGIWQALDIWATDNVPFGLQAFRDLISLFYQKNLFCRHEFPLQGRLVGHSSISVPTLSVAAAEDHVFTVSAAEHISESRAALDGKLEYHVIPAGHVTLIAAHPVRSQTFEIFRNFLRANRN
ncbi:MAG: hypothetical protein CVV64_07635 [Candidatus Wallbacteria bacterium HGW-Wallbacteria-1]|jgi:polyhydroxyalkanoate synthase|uniref:AB hydrolase-1 domain-containing protein n=1 Tax=Candidatus Wallbacteria bacterium HGW-Wallbacteria-1 TaxID=2013854 RepID=A0A2N1PQX3_9BACT|nr:MAG: hypothetical protein CVV64_07635 [Candidatus Wallbacteria bacterium HGW-Wallbacteria-1]